MSTAGILEFDVLGKPGACWRALTKDKGFAGRKAPTKKPAGRENPERVGVSRYLPSAAAMSFVYSRTLFRCVAFIGTNVDINSKKEFLAVGWSAVIVCNGSIFFLLSWLSYLRFLRFPAKILNSLIYQNPEASDSV